MSSFDSRDHAENIQVRYLIVNIASPYNIIIGRPSFNAFEEVLSTLYITLKYPIEDSQFRIVKGDQGISRNCYKDSLRLKRRSYVDELINGD